jgi:hypothetical protein
VARQHYQHGGPAIILTHPDHLNLRLYVLRRLLALVVLGATILSSAESALALKPDARLHGALTGVAMAHSDAGAVVGQGHPDADSTEHRQPHQGEHRHGSSDDHCSHAHAVGLAASSHWTSASTDHGDAIPTVVASYSNADLHRALRPPRA